jgi:hypothetical protein
MIPSSKIIPIMPSRNRTRLWHGSACFEAGRACPLCPGNSDIDLFRDSQGIVDFNAEVSDGAFDFGVAQQKLDRPKVARASVD